MSRQKSRRLKKRTLRRDGKGWPLKRRIVRFVRDGGTTFSDDSI